MRHPIVCYVAITYVVTWCPWLALAATGHHVGPGFHPIYLIGLLGPMLGSIGATALCHGRRGVRDLFARMLRVRVGMRWWGIAVGVPLVLAALTGIVVEVLGQPQASGRAFGAFTGFPMTSPLVLWALLVAIGGLGEETGWRGFLLPELRRRWSPVTSSLIVALVWALWHAPAFLIVDCYRAMPPALLPMFLIGLASGSVFLTWLYYHGRSSILLVAVWHATYNQLSGTPGAGGALAAVESTAVVVIAVVLIIAELHAHPVRPAWRSRATHA